MATIELSMIVKDGGADLERCLKSAAPFVDRMVIGDTGSSDNSREIARSNGAEVIAVPWEHDFAKARNQVLSARKCDWILVLYADEMIDPLSGANMREFAGGGELLRLPPRDVELRAAVNLPNRARVGP